jgi:hypothetical protein
LARSRRSHKSYFNNNDMLPVLNVRFSFARCSFKTIG